MTQRLSSLTRFKRLRTKVCSSWIRIRTFGPRCGLVCGHFLFLRSCDDPLLNVQLQEEEPLEEEEGLVEEEEPVGGEEEGPVEEETPSQTGLKFNVPQALR